jgi:hypothetical protein
MKFAILAALALMLFTGCASKSVGLNTRFDSEAAKRQISDGTNSVRGSGLIRQAGGGVVTCAGNPVFLMPVTGTAKEWATHVYGSPQGGYRPAGGRGVMFEGAEEFMSVVRTANCDVQGLFKFERVANGEFYVFTRVVWRVGGEMQGGSIMRPVDLTGGSSVDVVLSPSSL